MKKNILFLLLLIGAFAYSQVGSMNIFNFSTSDVSFKLVSSNNNNGSQDCVPVISNENYVTLTSGSVVAYSQCNTSHLQIPAINQWHVISNAIGTPSQNYNVSSGTLIPSLITNLTTWQSIDMNLSNGEHIGLGKHCGSPGGIFSGGTSVSATWTYSGNDVYIVIN